MKFAKYLESESVPEWRKAYINYKGLKKRLKAIEKYRKLSHPEERNILEQNNQPTNSEYDPEALYPNSLSTLPQRNKLPRRTQSSILDNRSTGLQPRSIPSRNLLKRFSSFRFGRQETELDQLTQPSLPAQELQSVSVLEEALRLASEPEQYFFIMLDQDLDTISRFYDEKEKEAEAKFNALKLQVQIVRDFAVQLSKLDSKNVLSGEGRLNPINWFKRRGSASSIDTANIPDLPASVEYNGEHHMSYNVARSRLKKAITEYYRSLELLRSYKILNETGFQKILKKFDKTAGWKASNLYAKKMNRYHWVKSKKIDEFLQDTENLYVDEFTDGHRRRGMAQLRTPEKDENYTSSTWRIGLYIGISIALLARCIELVLDPQMEKTLPNLEYNLQIYACFSLPILFCLGFSINILVWTRSHINYKFIFEFDPRDNLDYHEFPELPSLMLLILSFMMYIDFSQSFAPLIPSELCPLILFVIIIAVMTCPFPILYYSSRRWLGLSLGRIVLSYLFPIEFRDFFIADELNSLAYSFWTLTYFFCAYTWHWDDLSANCPVKIFWYTPFLACLPPWWRFLQCIRRYQDSREKVHLVNAIKYTTSIGSTLATGYRRMHPNASMELIWVMFSLINSSYTSAWDIKMDWGLLQSNSKHFLLRNNLVFYRWTYYVAAPVNIFLRFAWTLNAASLGYKGEMIGFVTAALEAYRRIQWNFFRLENEHINNCGNYRAIKEIPLPFAFRESINRPSSVATEEEGGIQLPVEPSEIPVPNTNQTPSLGPSRFADALGISPVGSFYGRRDFENRQDIDATTADTIRNFKRQPSIVGAVLERIQSKKTNADSSDTDLDDDEEEEEDEEEESD